MTMFVEPEIFYGVTYIYICTIF